MADRVCLELQLVKSRGNQRIPTDSQGNWILWAEASNENLDFQGQVVLQDALKKSEGYFLENGVISYDHRHLHADPEDPTWTPEKYIIGEPLAVKTKGKRTFVQFKLYKSNALAQQIVSKIRDGSTRVKTSIAGKVPQIIQEYSQKLGHVVEVVKGVLWDELALTFKPVNQTLAPVTPEQFVKSLTATPMPTNVAARTGGAALISSSNTPRKKSQIETGKNLEEEEEENEMDPKNLIKSVDDAVSELTKALRGGGRGKARKSPIGADPELPPEGDPDGDPDGDPTDDPDYDLEDDPDNQLGDPDSLDNGNGGMPPQAPRRRVSKSIEDQFRNDGYGEAIDASPILMALVKSVDTIARQQTQILSFQKSIGKVVSAQAELTKSFAAGPAPRAGAISTMPRAIGGAPLQNAGVMPNWSQTEIMEKALKARQAEKLSSQDYTILTRRVTRGEALPQAAIDLLKSI